MRISNNKQIIKRLVLLNIKLRRRKSKEIETESLTDESVVDTPKSISVLDSYYSNLKSFSLTSYVVIILLSLIFWSLLGTEVSLLILSLSGTSMDFQNFPIITSIMAIAAIASLVPLSISGIGIRDVIITALVLYNLQISAEFAFGASLIQTAFNMVFPALVGGIILLILRRRRIDQSD